MFEYQLFTIYNEDGVRLSGLKVLAWSITKPLVSPRDWR